VLVIPTNLVKDWSALAHQFAFSPIVYEHASLFREQLMPSPAFGRLVIVDEAHQFRNAASRRFAALAQLCVAQKVLLVTATPLWNSLSELEGLVSLIACDDSLRDAGVFSIEKAIRDRALDLIRFVVNELMVRSVPSGESAIFPAVDRRIVYFEAGNPGVAEELQTLEFPPFGSSARGLLRELLLLRLMSGEAAFREAIARQIAFCERAIEVAERGESLTRYDFARHFARELEAGGRQQLLFPELFGSGALRGDDLQALNRELRKLETLRRTPLRANKLSELVRIIGLKPGSRWLIFTSSVATAREIGQALHSFGVALVTAEADRSSHGVTREAMIESFRRGELAVLVATDWSSEGLNLQIADEIVHYDLPWNPSRLTQRTARACRLGRTEGVTSWFFVPKGRAFQGVMRTIRRKRNLIESVMSPMLNPRTLMSSGVLPAHLSRASGQFALAQELQRLRYSSDEWFSLLSNRYRAGAERLIREVSLSFIDPDRLQQLEVVLRSELSNSSIENV